MIVYRLAMGPFKEDLTGTGAKLFGGRWNDVGYPALYCTQYVSLAVLEILVRTGTNFLPVDYHLIQIAIPAKLFIQKIQKNKLKKDWKTDSEYTQWIGTEFLKTAVHPVLEIPSAIVDDENNFLLNPDHEDFKKIKIVSIAKFDFDHRLLLNNE